MEKSTTEIVKDGEDILAIIIRKPQETESVSFSTPNEFPLQMGTHHHKKGFIIKPHIHIPIKEIKNLQIQEVFFLQKGKIRITVYNKNEKPSSSFIINTGEAVLLARGHSMEFLEDSWMIEIKQGPYRGADKEKRYLE